MCKTRNPCWEVSTEIIVGDFTKASSTVSSEFDSKGGAWFPSFEDIISGEYPTHSRPRFSPLEINYLADIMKWIINLLIMISKSRY